MPQGGGIEAGRHADEALAGDHYFQRGRLGEWMGGDGIGEAQRNKVRLAVVGVMPVLVGLA